MIEIKSATDCETVEPWLLDLASFSSIRQFVQKFNAAGDGKLHLLIQNTAMITWTYARTMDGWESKYGFSCSKHHIKLKIHHLCSLQVNHLSSSLLVLLLLPNLKRGGTSSQPSRLVMVSSYGHSHISTVPEARA